MKLEKALLLLACAALAGCSLKDLLAKADDAGAAAPRADAGTSAAAAVDAAPAAVADAVNDAGPVAKNAANSAATTKAKSGVAAAAGSKPSASATTAAAPKCGPNQHFDDLNKKCRAFGDCPKGFHWNDPMKTCLADD